MFSGKETLEENRSPSFLVADERGEREGVCCELRVVTRVSLTDWRGLERVGVGVLLMVYQ